MEPNTGDRRVEDVNLIDMRVQKTFTLPRSPVRFDVFLDALNLTNSDQVERSARRSALDGVRRRRRRYIPPRRLQLGAKVRW